MKKAVIYVRVNSTLEEAEKQLEQLWTFAESKGYKVANAYYEVVSGAAHVHERTIWHMIEDARKGLFDTIIIKDIARISRKQKEALLVLNELKDLGVNLVSQHDDIEPQKELLA